MKNQKISSTRQLNKHWQSGDSKMRDFNYIWLSCYQLQTHETAGAGELFKELQLRKILLLPRNNRIYFPMTGYTSPDYHVFDPYIFSKDFKLQISGKEFSTADLYQSYVDHPEKFHNLTMDEINIDIAGETIPYYRIRFTDDTLEPSDYYIEFKWKDTKEENIHFTYYLAGGDHYLNYQLVGQKTLNLTPIHGYYSPQHMEIYSDCETDFIHYLTTDYVIDRSQYYIGTKRYHLYSYFFFPECSVEGGIRKIDINNIYTNSGGWNLGSYITANFNLMNFFFEYKYRNNPQVIYPGVLWYVYSQFNYDAPYFDIEIRDGEINLCKYYNADYGHITYEDPSLFVDGEPIMFADLNFIDYWALIDDPDEIQLNWIQLQKWRVDNG